VLRVLGNLARHLSRILLHLYDLLIVLPLLAEQLVRSLRGGEAPMKARPVDAPGKL
jgi:hypothetical protein